MKKNFVIGGIAVLVLVLTAAIFYLLPQGQEKDLAEGDPAGAQPVRTITSEDGMASLSLLPGTLPASVDSSEIGIAEVDPESSAIDFAGTKPTAIYMLYPDGLVLSEPAEVAIKVEMKEGEIPGLYHLSSDKFERVNGYALTVYEQSGITLITAKISHFSALVAKSDGFSAKINAPKEAYLKVPFNASAVITKTKQIDKVIIAAKGTPYTDKNQDAFFDIVKSSLGITGNVQGEMEVAEIYINNPWMLQGEFLEDKQGKLTPKTIKNAPEKTGINKDTYTQNAAFECEDIGPSTVIYKLEITAGNVDTVWKTPRSIDIGSINIPLTINSNPIECKAALPAEDENKVSLPPAEGEGGDKVKVGGDEDIKEAPKEEPKEAPKEEPKEESKEEAEAPPKVADKEYTYAELAKMNPDQIRALGQFRISALAFNGQSFPFPSAQFTFCISCAPVCESPHFHGAAGFSLDLKSVPEPALNCFWGDDVKSIIINPDQVINWFHNKP